MNTRSVKIRLSASAHKIPTFHQSSSWLGCKPDIIRGWLPTAFRVRPFNQPPKNVSTAGVPEMSTDITFAKIIFDVIPSFKEEMSLV